MKQNNFLTYNFDQEGGVSELKYYIYYICIYDYFLAKIITFKDMVKIIIIM